jgi:hypothetical protein
MFHFETHVIIVKDHHLTTYFKNASKKMNISDATPYDATFLLVVSLGYLEVSKPTKVHKSLGKPATSYGWSEHTLNMHSSAHQPKTRLHTPNYHKCTRSFQYKEH